MRKRSSKRETVLQIPPEVAGNAAPIAECLLCGHEQVLAAWRDGTSIGVCEECRNLAATNRGPCSPLRDCACWHRSMRDMPEPLQLETLPTRPTQETDPGEPELWQQQIVREKGMCGALVNDGHDVCICEPGHDGGIHDQRPTQETDPE